VLWFGPPVRSKTWLRHDVNFLMVGDEKSSVV
jgi:hypothetical protein